MSAFLLLFSIDFKKKIFNKIPKASATKNSIKSA